LLIGRGGIACELLLCQANQGGFVAGATGTGKTVTLQVLAEAITARSWQRAWASSPRPG
jgi:uncharacterized protein